jgi:Flp pilus assembly protein TadD
MQPRRNDPCPCGSGRKYKKCCEISAIAPGNRPDVERIFGQAREQHIHGQLQKAELLCQQVLAAHPEHVEALHLLGVLAGQTGQQERAVQFFGKALAVAPSHSLALTNLAVALRELGRSEEALGYVQKAADLTPESLHAVRNCALLLTGLGRWAEAIPFFERWAALEPENAGVYQALGACYARQGLGPQAASCYVKSLELDPDSAEVGTHLGAWLVEESVSAPVLAFLCQVVERNPASAAAWANLGAVTKNLGDLNTALRCYERAVALHSSHAGILWNRSLCLLSVGRLAEGWADYEYRWQAKALRQKRPFSQKQWDGCDAAGKTILVWMEQGLGDQIAFAGMLPDLLRAGAHVIVECDPRLVALLKRSFAAEVVASTEKPDPRTERPDIDFQVPAGSLPRYFRSSLDCFPQHPGYLVPDAARTATWSRRLSALGAGLKVGICWRSMVAHGARSLYYAQLNQWGPILTIPGVHFVNLQYDQCDEELRGAETLFGIAIHQWEDVDLRLDQEEVAALIASLDLVISAGTAVDQMAGALGRPTWVLTRGSGDWWSLGTDHCPWYPSVRAFHGRGSEPWKPLIERMASELRKMTAATSGVAEALQTVESA